MLFQNLILNDAFPSSLLTVCLYFVRLNIKCSLLDVVNREMGLFVVLIYIARFLTNHALTVMPITQEHLHIVIYSGMIPQMALVFRRVNKCYFYIVIFWFGLQSSQCIQQATL